MRCAAFEAAEADGELELESEGAAILLVNDHSGEALIARVSEKLGPLIRIGEDAVRADVVLQLLHSKKTGRMYTASARLTLPTGDIHASATRANLYKAISDLENRLARRLGKRKTRFENRIEMDRPNDGTTSAARLEESILSA